MSVAVSALALYQWKREDVDRSDGTPGWVSRHREQGWSHCSVRLGKEVGLQLCAARGSGEREMPAGGGTQGFPVLFPPEVVTVSFIGVEAQPGYELKSLF